MLKFKRIKVNSFWVLIIQSPTLNVFGSGSLLVDLVEGDLPFESLFITLGEGFGRSSENIGAMVAI